MSRAERVLAVAETVMDPEIPVVSVVDLGIVREVAADGGAVWITPTYSGCPATAAIAADLRAALDVAGLAEVRIETRLAPAWTTDWISESGRRRLADYGVAPPTPASVPDCPRCGARETEEVSAFGSTPCKAQWRCTACGEPFDRFKCH
ncbi:MAG TPA: 1,2-phenylacetyl-CoA epoxidase subunit PaaD [Caulobacteraceae bacterium]